MKNVRLLSYEAEDLRGLLQLYKNRMDHISSAAEFVTRVGRIYDAAKARTGAHERPLVAATSISA